MPSIPETHRDLLEAPVAILGTNGPDGYPQLSATWFQVEGETVRLSLSGARQKTKNLRRDPRVSVILPDATLNRYVEIRGQAEVEPDTDGAFAARVGAKYQADLSAYDEPGDERLVVTIRATRVRTWG